MFVARVRGTRTALAMRQAAPYLSQRSRSASGGTAAVSRRPARGDRGPCSSTGRREKRVGHRIADRRPWLARPRRPRRIAIARASMARRRQRDRAYGGRPSPARLSALSSASSGWRCCSGARTHRTRAYSTLNARWRCALSLQGGAAALEAAHCADAVAAAMSRRPGRLQCRAPAGAVRGVPPLPHHAHLPRRALSSSTLHAQARCLRRAGGGRRRRRAISRAAACRGGGGGGLLPAALGRMPYLAAARARAYGGGRAAAPRRRRSRGARGAAGALGRRARSARSSTCTAGRSRAGSVMYVSWFLLFLFSWSWSFSCHLLSFS